MSPSDATRSLSLTVDAADRAAEIFVLDGRLQLVDRGVGNLVTRQDPGVYKVKVRVGQVSQEQLVLLRDQPETVRFEAMAFSSPAPLWGTAKTHEYHIVAAERESSRSHVQIGTGAKIFVCARDWTSRTSSEGPPGEPSHPARGLSLASFDGQTVVDIERQGVSDLHQDPWAACSVELDPGVYRLRLEVPGGLGFEQILVAAPGWQTQLFVLLRSYGDGTSADKRADLMNGAVLMTRGAFAAGDEILRLTELARQGLADRRRVLRKDMLAMVADKFENPMLGIFGAHLLLREKDPDMALLGTVVDHLRGLLGLSHPDVEALAWRVGRGSPDYRFTAPPMLRRSWGIVLDTTVTHPQLVPPDSLASNVATRLWSDEPWLIWTSAPAGDHDPYEDVMRSLLEVGLPLVGETIERIGEGLTRQLATTPKAGGAGVLQRGIGAVFTAVGRALGTVRARSPAPAPLGEEAVKALVARLGLPRGSIETLVRRLQTLAR